MSHIPVLGTEAVSALKPSRDGIYIDATFGRGGYSQLLLERGAGKVIAIDRDPEAIAFGEVFVERYSNRFQLLQGCFGDMNDLIKKYQIEKVNGVVFDIGVSSPQFDTPDRGFSFRLDGPLDMRMSQEGKTAADIINETPERELADILYLYGEERASRKISSKICYERKINPITRTSQLAQIIASVVPKKDETHPATKSFQALRIVVNNELEELEKGISTAIDITLPKGRIAVVTFHSLEDRIVKNLFRKACGRVSNQSRHRPIIHDYSVSNYKMITSKPIIPSEKEIQNNSRARSAKLRVIERVGTAL